VGHLALAAVLALTSPASATVPDRFGQGARWQARGGGSVALVDDGTAACVNPAGLAAADRSQLAVGLVGARPSVQPVPSVWWDTNRDGVVDERDPPLQVDPTPPPVFGLDLAVLGRLGDRAALGLSVWFPTAALVRLYAFEPDLPYYVRWGNRTQRANVAMGLGVDTVGGLRLGVSADMGVRARATVRVTLDATASAGAATTTATTASTPELGGELVYDVNEIDLTVVPTVAPVIGLQWQVGEAVAALDGLTVGARYHGATGMPLDVIIDAQANVGVDDLAEDPYVAALVGQSELALLDHDVPRRVELGVGYQLREAFSVHLDARWTDWRGLTVNVARVVDARIDAPLVDLADAVRDGNPLAYQVRSTWGVRAGLALRLPVWEVGGALRTVQPIVRGGGAIDPTPLIDPGPSAMLDGDHHLLTGGLGVEVGQPFDDDGVIALDLMIQGHRIARGELLRSSASPRAGYPVTGRALPVGGAWVASGAQVTVRY